MPASPTIICRVASQVRLLLLSHERLFDVCASFPFVHGHGERKAGSGGAPVLDPMETDSVPRQAEEVLVFAVQHLS